MVSYRDVKTGNLISRAEWSVFDSPAFSWDKRGYAWVTCAVTCTEPPTHDDAHLYEVALICAKKLSTGEAGYRRAIWPILAFWSEEAAREWEQKLRAFAATLDPTDTLDYFDVDVNGDRRLGQWLTENGFTRLNYCCWAHRDRL